MGRLVALVCNNPDRLRCVLHPAQAALVAAPDLAQHPRGFDAWGIGLYQSGEVLLKRRPQPTTGPLDFYAIASELRTDTLIAHARIATVGDNRNENTHPFRFRSWLFAHHGTLPGFGGPGADPARPSPAQEELAKALREEIPDFLRRNMRGQTDSELLFHLFLTRLHEAGQLDVPEVRLPEAQAALEVTLRRLEHALRTRGVASRPGEHAGSFGALTLANGRFLIAAARGTRLDMMTVRGIKDCPVCREPERPIDHDLLRSVTFVADLPAVPEAALAPMKAVADGTIVTVSRDLTIREIRLDPGA